MMFIEERHEIDKINKTISNTVSIERNISEAKSDELWVEHLISWLELEANLIIGHSPKICQYYSKKYPIQSLIEVITNPTNCEMHPRVPNLY